MINNDKITTSLRKWAEFAKQDIIKPVKGTGILCYGSGYNNWGVQTQQKAISVFLQLASLSRDCETEYESIGLNLLRYNLRSHIEGDLCCTDGARWGHSWISVLGVERMMFAVEAVMDRLSNDDRALLKRVLISEATWLLNEYEIVAGLTENNKPESNIWNGALLYRVSLMYPEDVEVEKLQNKAVKFFLNGISTEEDLGSGKCIDGVLLKDNVVGANFFNSMSLNHHGYLNVGYMVICLSNIAMLHFSKYYQEQPMLESLYHNMAKLWQVIRHCTFEDGRLWRIGGDTRVRYCYCQDYALPMWAVVRDHIQEDVGHWAEGWLSHVYLEQDQTGDGSYLGERLQHMATESPLYYTRLESDRACSLAMAMNFFGKLEKKEKSGEVRDALTDSWSDKYHGANSHVGKKRRSSFVWRGGEGPVGMCLPVDNSGLAEWRSNCFPKIQGLGDNQKYEFVDIKNEAFEGGFASHGVVNILEEGYLAEGVLPHSLAQVRQLFIALPDDETIICLQYAQALGTHRIKNCYGGNIYIPNDLYNGRKRKYTIDGEIINVKSMENATEMMIQNELTVDNQLGFKALYNQFNQGSPSATLRRFDHRSIGLKGSVYGSNKSNRLGGFLACDEILMDGVSIEPSKGSRLVMGGDILLDCGFSQFVGETGSHAYTCDSSQSDGAFKKLVLTGKNKSFVVYANFSSDDKVFKRDERCELVAGDIYKGDKLLAGTFALFAR